MTWGLRKKFADGKFSVGYSRFLGYDKGEDGNRTMVINAKRPMGNMPVAYYRGENQGGLRHGIQQAGDGAGWRKRRITLLRQH